MLNNHDRPVADEVAHELVKLWDRLGHDFRRPGKNGAAARLREFWGDIAHRNACPATEPPDPAKVAAERDEQARRESGFQALLRDPPRALAAALADLRPDPARLGPAITDPAALSRIGREIVPGVAFQHGAQLGWVEEAGGDLAVNAAAQNVMLAEIGGYSGLMALVHAASNLVGASLAQSGHEVETREQWAAAFAAEGYSPDAGAIWFDMKRHAARVGAEARATLWDALTAGRILVWAARPAGLALCDPGAWPETGIDRSDPEHPPLWFLLSRDLPPDLTGGEAAPRAAVKRGGGRRPGSGAIDDKRWIDMALAWRDAGTVTGHYQAAEQLVQEHGAGIAGNSPSAKVRRLGDKLAKVW